MNRTTRSLLSAAMLRGVEIGTALVLLLTACAVLYFFVVGVAVIFAWALR